MIENQCVRSPQLQLSLKLEATQGTVRRESLTEIKPCQELERDKSPFGQVEQFHCVHHPFWGHQDVDDSEILLEPVADKCDSFFPQVQELEIGGLQGGDVLGAPVGIQVPCLDPREFGEIVHHLQQTGVLILTGVEDRR